MDPAQTLDWARARQDEMEALLRELVEIESPSTDAAAVERLARRVARELDGVGLATELLPVMGGGPVLRATGGGLGAESRRDGSPQGPRDGIHSRRVPPEASAAPVMMLGHLDTVWPLGTLDARPLRRVGDALYGPGTFDMKGGLVVALFALRALRARGPLPAVSVFFTPLEEVDCAAYRERMEADMRAAAAVLDFEPAWPGGAVKTERKGSGSVVVRARGRAAHAGADFEKGANAILELARQTLDAAALTDLSSGVTVNPGVVRGGLRPNVVPDFASLEVDFRVRTLADGRRVEQALRALRPHDPRVTLEIDGGLHYPPLERTAEVARVFETARAVAAELGMELREISTGGASEASFASALGRPTLDGLGADGDGAHAEEEHVLVSSMPPRVALAALLIARLAREQAGA